MHEMREMRFLRALASRALTLSAGTGTALAITIFGFLITIRPAFRLVYAYAANVHEPARGGEFGFSKDFLTVVWLILTSPVLMFGVALLFSRYRAEKKTPVQGHAGALAHSGARGSIPYMALHLQRNRAEGLRAALSIFSILSLCLGWLLLSQLVWMIATISTGTASVAWFSVSAYRRVRTIVVPPTEVVISIHPATIGQIAYLWLRQRGSFRVQSLHGKLVCTERIRSGDARSGKRELFSKVLFSESSLNLMVGMPFIWEGPLEIPDDLPPSRETSDGSIVWTIVIEGDVARLPNIRHGYVLHVEPAPIGHGAYRDGSIGAKRG